MSLASLGYDSCSYTEKLRSSVGPGMYMLTTPGNDDIAPCSQDIPADPYMRYQHWGAGTCYPGSAVDDSSELLGLPYKLSKCSGDAYAPGKYVSKPKCSAPGTTPARNDVCSRPTEDTRLSNPACTLKGTGWNRWEWLCYNPQDKAIIPFEWNTSYRIVAKDNHVPCVEVPMDQTGFSPATTISAQNQPQQIRSYGLPGSSGWDEGAPGNPSNSGFSTCSTMNQL